MYIREVNYASMKWFVDCYQLHKAKFYGTTLMSQLIVVSDKLVLMSQLIVVMSFSRSSTKNIQIFGLP